MRRVPENNPVTVRNICRLPKFIIDGIKYKLAGKLYMPKPLFSTARITHRCNSRCLACTYWKENSADKELSPEEFGEIYKDPLFSSLEKITLSGGEPTLRDDLPDIADNILRSCRRIKRMTLCTNGFDSERVIGAVRNLLQLREENRIPGLTVSVSLDGTGQLHETIRRVPQAFEKVNKTITSLQKLQRSNNFILSVVCVVQPLNMLFLKDMAIYGIKNNLPVSFVPICTSNVFIDDDVRKKYMQFDSPMLEELRRMFENTLGPYLSTPVKAFWQDYFRVIRGSGRRIPCYRAHYFVDVDIDGILRGCSFDNDLIYGHIRKDTPYNIWFSDKAKHIRVHIARNYCPECSIYCDVGTSFEKEFFYYAGYLLHERWRILTGRSDNW